jgi:hypothetical protein
MLFFIQFWRIPPSLAKLAYKPVLRWHRCDTGVPVPLLATTKFFSLQVEPTGMLAPKVQATTIEVRLRRGPDRRQWWTTTKEIRRLRTFALCFGNRSRNRSRSVPIPSVLEPAGYAPFERGEIQRRTGQAYQAHGTHLLDGLHHHDGRRGIDQHF